MKLENEINYRFDSEDERLMYWAGPMNYGMRLFYYLLQGCDVYNQVRNYFIVVVLAYLALKIDNYGLLAAMFAISTPLTMWIGHFKIHKMAKNHEWLQVHFGTKYGKESIELQRKQLEATNKTLTAVELLNKRLSIGYELDPITSKKSV